MMMSYEPPLIKYEEVLLEEEKQEPSDEETKDEKVNSGSSSEDDSEEDEDENLMSATLFAEQERADEIRNKTVSRILDFTFIPREIEKDGKKYLLRLSREAATREEVIELDETFEKYLKDRQVRMKGFCPIRRELYDLLFDELIRQATISCAERGSLLLRVRDEFRMTMIAYERLYENGVAYGTRKASEAEIEERKIESELKQLQDEVARGEKRVKDLQAVMEAEEQQSRARLTQQQARHQEKMEFLRKLNQQLKEQISIIL